MQEEEDTMPAYGRRLCAMHPCQGGELPLHAHCRDEEAAATPRVCSRFRRSFIWGVDGGRQGHR